MKTILAISGSLREGSSNHNILRFLKGIAPANIDYKIYQGISSIPAFDPGLDNDNPPITVTSLREDIAGADGIIICTPEYAFGVPGALKNAIDWMVSSGSFSGKPVALITASTGGQNAHEAMIKILGAIDTNLTPETTLLISFIRSKMDADGNIMNEEVARELKGVFLQLIKLI